VADVLLLLPRPALLLPGAGVKPNSSKEGSAKGCEGEEEEEEAEEEEAEAVPSAARRLVPLEEAGDEEREEWGCLEGMAAAAVGAGVGAVGKSAAKSSKVGSKAVAVAAA
jgi:hypothetical protein